MDVSSSPVQVGQNESAAIVMGGDDLRLQRESLTEDASGGEQDASGGEDTENERSSSIKAGASNGTNNLRDSTRSAFLIAALLATFGALALAAIGIVLAAFSDMPKRAATAHAPAVVTNGSDVESSSARALLADDGGAWVSWRTTEEAGGVWRACAIEAASGRPLSMRDAVAALRAGRLGGQLMAVLHRSPHAASAFFWELPAFTFGTAASVPLEMVTVRAPALVGTVADSSPFASHLAGGCSGGAASVTTFANLGGDAQLVAPCAASGVPTDMYASLAPFLRSAPAAQVAALWVAVGSALEATLRARGEQTPTWVNTEGSGVGWLHVRLDSTPKYYHFHPYRRFDPSRKRAAAGHGDTQT